jgi:hypothetical protein
MILWLSCCVHVRKWLNHRVMCDRSFVFRLGAVVHESRMPKTTMTTTMMMMMTTTMMMMMMMMMMMLTMLMTA